MARPAVASLARPAYPTGDSVLIHLSRPLTQLMVTWDGQSVPATRTDADTLAVPTANRKTGLHQLVVRGITTDKELLSDTLLVELLSDVVPTELRYSVLKTYPHQASSFTQGLEFYGGHLYEGTGLNGQSQLMEIDLPTGKPLRAVTLPEQHFGEGITVVKDKFYQLTWTSGLCFRYNADFVLEKTFTYPTQGWGLTHRDTTLILSDGSNKLYFYTPDFRRTAEVSVYDITGPVTNLNELEYVDGYVFANIWQTNRIIQIDPASGKVVGYLNMERTLPTGIDTKQNVLNGIAHQPTDNTLYVTGKNWPVLVKIRLTDSVRRSPKMAVRN